MLYMILAVSTLYDLLWHRIPNFIILLGILSGIYLEGFLFFPPFLSVVAAGIPLFYFGMIGAGDIKLMAVLMGSMGFDTGLLCILIAWILAALISLFKLFITGTLQTRLCYFIAYFRQYFQTKVYTPYYEKERDGYEFTLRFSIPLSIAYLSLQLWNI